jgi:hypothetical protein
LSEATSSIERERFLPPPIVKVWQRRAVTAAIPLTVLALVGWALAYLRPGNDEFYRAYLLGFVWLIGFSLGPMALLMVYHTTGGAWGTVIRRPLEAATRTIWVVALAFVPVWLSARRLYPWASPGGTGPDVRRLMSQYLNLPLFTLRAVLYFAAWIGLMIFLTRVSDRQDRDSTPMDKPLRHVSGAGLVVYVLTLTLAAVDWVMSLSPPWASTIYGLLYLAGHGLTGLSLAVIVLAALVRHAPMDKVVKSDQFLDLGKLLLALTMIWGWFTLSQWLLIWAGNLPDEISWYLARSSQGWHGVAWLVVLGQFFIPFFILLSRGFKSNPRKLQKLAFWILFVRYCDLFWYIIPNFANRRAHFGYSWQYAVVPLAMLSWWLALYFHHLGRRPLLAVCDDHVKLVLAEGHATEHQRA